MSSEQAPAPIKAPAILNKIRFVFPKLIKLKKQWAIEKSKATKLRNKLNRINTPASLGFSNNTTNITESQLLLTAEAHAVKHREAALIKRMQLLDKKREYMSQELYQLGNKKRKSTDDVDREDHSVVQKVELSDSIMNRSILGPLSNNMLQSNKSIRAPEVRESVHNNNETGIHTKIIRSMFMGQLRNYLYSNNSITNPEVRLNQRREQLPISGQNVHTNNESVFAKIMKRRKVLGELPNNILHSNNSIRAPEILNKTDHNNNDENLSLFSQPLGITKTTPSIGNIKIEMEENGVCGHKKLRLENRISI